MCLPRVRAGGVRRHVALAAAAATALLTAEPTAAAAWPEAAWRGGDDECAGGGEEAGGSCALSALQRRGARVSARQLGGAPRVSSPALAPAPAATAFAPAPVPAAELVETGQQEHGIWHYAQNCWRGCGNQEGFCPEFCGPGNACCDHGSPPQTPECAEVKFWSITLYHTCVPTRVQPGDGDRSTTTEGPIDAPSEPGTTDPNVDYGDLPPPPAGCEDASPMCPPWAANGECSTNSDYMKLYCKVSCDTCAKTTAAPAQQYSGPCQDNDQSCYIWSTRGQCDDNPGFMHANCPKSCNLC